MKKGILQFCLLFLFSYSLSAGINLLPNGNYKKIYTEAEKYFNNGNYNDALPLFIRLDSMEKGNANINYKVGFCYLNAATYKTKSINFA